MIAGRTYTILWARVAWCVGLTTLMVALPTTPGFAQNSGEATGAGSGKKSGQEKAGEAGDEDKTAKSKEGDEQKDKKNTKKPGKGNSKKDGKEGTITIDSDLQKRIDDLVEPKGKQRAEKAPKARSKQPPAQPPKPKSKPSARPSSKPGTRGSPAGAKRAEKLGDTSVPINIPALEDVESDLPPEEREYEFSLKDATYEQLIEGIARQTGLGVIGHAPKGGKVSFITTERLNFVQLMDRVRTLLFNFKPLDPYTIRRQETHLEVLRVNDALRKLSPESMFQSVEAFLASGLSASELALVIYTPTSGSVADLNEIRNFLPDYIRVAPLEGQNRVTIFALVSDIYKYLDLITFFHSDSDDPRPIEEITVINILPSLAITKLEELMDLSAGSPTRGKSRKTGGRGTSTNLLMVIKKFEVTLVPEDSRGVIIVRAMQDKIDEIKRLLPYVDVDTAKDYLPVVIELEHADPNDIIAIIQQILAASEGSQSGIASRAKSRIKKKRVSLPSTVKTAELTLIPHPAGEAIIVMGEEEQIQRVRELVAKFDVEIEIGPLQIALEHAEAGEVVDRVKQVLSSGGSGRKGKVKGLQAAMAFRLVADSSGKAVWYTGPKKDLDEVRQLIAEFDEKSSVGPLQIILEHAEASAITSTIKQVLAASPGGGKAKRTAQLGFRLVADPLGSALWFTGSEKDLATVSDLVATLDVAEQVVSLRVVVLEHGDPSFVADMLRQFDGGPVKPRRKGKSKGKEGQSRRSIPTAAKFTPDENGRLLVMCTDEEWELYLPLIEQLDATFAEEEDPFRRITLTYLEPAEAIEQFTTVFGPEARAVRYVETGGDLLVIGATDGQFEDMNALLTEIDAPSGLEQRTFEILYADPGEIVTIIQEFVGDGGPQKPKGKRPPGKGGRKGRGVAVQVTVSTEAMSIVQLERQLVVRATAAKMEEIAAIIAEFDVPEPAEQPFIRLEIAHIPTSQAIERLEVALGASGSKGSAITMVPTAGGILLFGANEYQVEDARAVLAEFDRPSDLKQRIFLIQHVDTDQLVNLLDTLVSDQPVGRRAGGKPGGKKGKERQMRTTGGSAASELQIVQLGDRLVVTATEAKMEQVAELIEEFDVAEETAELKVYEDFPRGADIDAIAQTLSTILDGVPASGRRPKKGAAKAEGAPRFIPQSAAGKLVVIAKPSKFEKIEELLEVLRVGIEVEQPEIAFIVVEYADPVEVVEKITPLLSIKVQTLIQEGTLTTAPLEGEVAGKAPKGGKGRRRGTTQERFHLEPDTRNKRIVVAAAPVVIEEATLLIREFDKPTESPELKVYDDFPRGADIDAIAEALSTHLDGARAPGRRAKKGAAKTEGGPQFIPQSAAGRLLVIAKPSMFEKIEEFLEVLSVGSDADQPEIGFIYLEYADAEEVVAKITPLLSIKVGRLIDEGKLTSVILEMEVGGKAAKGGKGRRRATGQQRFHLEPDPRNKRIVVAAPPVVIEEATILIREFDRPDESAERVFRTVALHNSEADEMVAAVTEMMAGTASRRKRSKSGKGKKPVAVASSDEGLMVTTAPGGGAVLLHGIIEEVERATGWIEQLDSEAVFGREIKVYEIFNADIETLVDVIMNVVDTPGKAGKPPKAQRKRRVDELLGDEFEFETTLTRVGNEVYIQADLISNTMLVAAGKNKLARIDDLVLKFEESETLADMGGGIDNMPMEIFDLIYADPFDAAWDLELVLGALWQPADQLPLVEEAPFGNALIVRYPYEDRFAEIEDLIAKYVDKRPEPMPPVHKKFPVPPGMTPEQAAQWLALHHPELNIKVLDVTPGEEDEGVDIEQVKPLKTARAHQCVLPSAFARAVAELTAAAVAVTEETDSSNEQPDEEEEKEGKDQKPEPAGVDALLSETASQFMAGTLGSPPEGDAPDEDPDVELDPVDILIDTKENALIFRGSEDDVTALEEALAELKEEIDRLGGPPDIRVYRVKFIDVYAAQDIIEEMYNTPKRDIANIRRAQQEAQKAAQRRLQLLAQQRGQGGGKGKAGEDGKPGQQPGVKGQQQQVSIPQIPPTTVRVYPNPRDRTLILRAETSQYPAILKLLATIDQPRPFESKVRIFHLEKNNAAEVEQLLKTFLGIEDSRGKRRTTGSTSKQATTQRGGEPSRLIMQETNTLSGKLGVDPADIKITANADTNTIIAMAPTVALDQIEEFINDLESHELPERITKHYTLEHADVQETADYLNTHFEEGSTTTGSKRRAGKKGGAQQASPRSGPKALNAPTFIAFTRLSLLTAQATQVQIDTIDELIEVLDVASETDEWVTVTLAHADAGVVAGTLSTLFSGTPGSSRRGGTGRGGPKGAAAGPTFIGADGDKLLFFSAPKNQHERIHEVIAQLEEQSEVSTEVRIIQLEHAEPSTVAEAIVSAYSGGNRGGGRRSGGRRGSGGSTSSFTITPHDPSKRLFVVADDQLFIEIESLAKTLDQTREMPFEMKIYPLQHANAREVHETLKALVRGWVQSSGGGRRGGMGEAFAVEVNDKANALIVLGSEVVFDFVEKALTTVDTPANAASPPGFLMVALKNANAQEVAQNINRLWGRRSLPRGETPPQVEANRTLNMLIVHGSEAQIEEIQKNIIDPLDEHTPPKLLTETITLEHAQPEAVADSINRIFEDKKRASQALGGRRSNVAPLEFTVVVTPDVDTRQLIIQASEENMKFVKTRVAELDQPEFASLTATTMEIYQVKYADPNAVVNIITQWARSRTQGGPRRRQVASRDVVTAVAEHATQTVVVTASVSNHLIIKELIEGLDSDEVATGKRKRQVIALQHANSDQVATQLTQLARQAQRRRGDRGPSFVSAPTTNSILALVNDAELEEITGLLKTIDVEPGIDIKRTMKVYHIKYADPNGIVNTINQTYRGNRGRQVRAVDQVVAVSEWATQSVIVTASAKNHEKIKALIEEIDQEGVGSQAFETVHLQYANSDELARQLNDVYGRSRRTTRRGQQPVTIASSPRANAIIIRGKESDIEDIKELIAAFDVEESMDTQRTTAVYPLRYSDPNSLNAVVLNMFRWDRRTQVSPSEKVTSAVDWGTQSIVVTASEKNHKVIATLVEQVDKESTFKKQKQLIRLEHANAEDVSRTMGQVLRATQRRTRRGDTPVSISADAGTNSLVIVASESDLEELLPLIEAFDVEPPVDKEPVITAYPVRHADVRGLAAAISQAFRSRGGRRPRPEDQVTAVGEAGTQTVIVTAVPKNQQKIKAFIDHIDIESDFVPQPHVYRLEHADAEELARSLQQQYRGGRGQQVPQISAVPSTNSLLIRATARDMEELAELIKPLDVKPDPERDQQIKSFRLSYADPSSVENAINRLFRPSGRSRSARDQVSAVPEWGSKSVIVSASPDNMKRVEALIADLDSEGGGQGEVEVINIEHADPAGVARALNEVFVRSMRSRGGGGEQPISISEIPGSKAILVKASATDMERIKETVTELDSDVFQAGETVRVIPLVRSDANEMKTAVEAMLAKPGKGRGRSGDLVGDMRISVLTQANALVISGSQEEVDRLEATILAMDAEAGEGTKAKFIRLAYADPERILPMLQDLYTNPRGGSGRRGKMQPVITATQAPKGLFVRADPMDFSEIVATIEQLDTEEAGKDEAVRVVQLVRSDANEMKTVVEGMLAKTGEGKRRGGELVGDMRVSVLTQANALVISGNQEEVDDLAATILSMDAEAGEGTQAQFIRLTYADPDRILPMLQDLYTTASRNSSRRGKMQPVITATQAPKGLFVRADPMDFSEIVATIEQLDTVEAGEDEAFRIVGPVPQGHDIERLAADLEGGLNDSAKARAGQSGSGRGRGSAPSVTITTDLRSRTLFVTGSASMFDQVEAAVAAMQATGPVGPTTVRVIDTIMLSVDDVRRILAQMKGEGSGTSSGRSSSSSRSRRR